jgi:L-amino acid N-acyltransferase YncA
MTIHATAPHPSSVPHTTSQRTTVEPEQRDLDRPRERLRDGRPVRIRHITGADRQGLLEFLRRLSPESRRTRFFSAGCDLRGAANWAASANQRTHIAILALDVTDTIIGHASCCRIDGRRAEVAVEIDATYRHQGLATILIARLAQEAEQAGVRTLIAEVLPENRDMLAVFHDGFDAHQDVTPDEVDIEFPCSAWRRLNERLHV